MLVDHSIKTKKEYKNLKIKANSIKLVFNMTWLMTWDFKGLTRRTTSNKVNIAKNPKYDEYQLRITPVVDKCFDKKASGRAIKM